MILYLDMLLIWYISTQSRYPLHILQMSDRYLIILYYISTRTSKMSVDICSISTRCDNDELDASWISIRYLFESERSMSDN